MDEYGIVVNDVCSRRWCKRASRFRTTSPARTHPVHRGHNRAFGRSTRKTWRSCWHVQGTRSGGRSMAVPTGRSQRVLRIPPRSGKKLRAFAACTVLQFALVKLGSSWAPRFGFVWSDHGQLQGIFRFIRASIDCSRLRYLFHPPVHPS